MKDSGEKRILIFQVLFSLTHQCPEVTIFLATSDRHCKHLRSQKSLKSVTRTQTTEEVLLKYPSQQIADRRDDSLVIYLSDG